MKNVLNYQSTNPPIHRVLSFVVAVMLMGIFLPNILSAQPQSIFYRAWTQTGGAVSPGFINRVVTIAGTGGVSYTASSVLISTNTYGMRLTKYSSSGTTTWVANFDLGAGGSTHVGGIALDASGNVLVTGSAYNGSGNGQDLYLVKYNSSGTKQWHHTYNGAGTGTDVGSAVICNASGDIFVTGMATQTFPNMDALTLCYASNGTLNWTQTWDNASLIDAGATLSLLGTRVFVTGATQTNFNTWEYAVLRYEQSNGSFVGATITSAGGTNIELVSAATTDAAGNVYLTGALGVSGQGFNIKTIKLSPTLAILWTANWNGAANLDDAGRSIAVDTAGNVFVAGYTTASDRNGVLLKYSPSGSLLTATGDNAAGAGEFTGIALTSAQEVFVGGYTTLKGNKDFLAIFYANDGSLRWSDTYNGYANEDDAAQQVTSDGSGNFLLSGTSGASTLTIKYTRHSLLMPIGETVNSPFIENRGQLLNTDERPADEVRYYTRSNYPNVYILDDRASFAFSHIDTSASTVDTMTRIDLTFESHGQGGGATIATGLERQDDFHNYYLGHIPEGRERVPLENKVLHPDIYTNIDALYGLGQDGFFMRFICKPGSTPGHIQMRFTGQTAISIQSNGSLRVETDLEDLILAAPTALFCDASGTESAPSWAPAFVLNSDGSVGFSVGSVPGGSSLILKTGKGRDDDYEVPSWWSTYYGWTGFDTETAVDIDQQYRVYTCGQSRSQNFPVGNFVLSAQGESDWAINKFSISGVPVWFTMIGGSGVANGDIRERAHDISVGAAEFLYVGGAAVEWDPDMFKNPNGGHHDINYGNIPLTRGAVVRMTKDLGQLKWATYFGDGGKLNEDVLGVEAMENGGVAVVGFAHDIVNAGTWQNVNPGGNAHQQSFGDMFIGTFNATDHLLWATKFGPNNPEPNEGNAATDVKADADGNLFVVGLVIGDASNNDKFPIGGGLTYKGAKDGFVAKFAGNRELTWCTYIGGTSGDRCSGIAYDANSNNMVVLGSTSSTVGQGFPIVSSGNPNVDDATMEGGDLFLARFSTNGTLLHSRYFGGVNGESTDIFSFAFPELQPCNGIDIAPDGSIFITGAADNGLPVIWSNPSPPWYFPNHSGGKDAFVAALAPDFKLNYCTYLGSRNNDNGTGIAVASLGSEPGFVSIMVGRTQLVSDDYPTAKETPLTYYSSGYFGGPFDGIITKIGTPGLFVGIEEKTMPEHTVKTSPNPCDEVLFLQIDGKYMDDALSTISIYDITGKLIQQSKVPIGQGAIQIDTKNLPSGAYLMTVSFATGQWSGTFVKSSH